MLTGAILGGVGSILNRGLSIFEAKQQAKIDEKRRSDQLEIAQLNASEKSIVASYDHDKNLSTNVSMWVANLRALVRPCITAYALGLVTLFYFLGSHADKAILTLMASEMATMTVTWWFADRFKR